MKKSPHPSTSERRGRSHFPADAQSQRSPGIGRRRGASQLTHAKRKCPPPESAPRGSAAKENLPRIEASQLELAYTALADACLNDGQSDAAVAALREAISVNPCNAAYYRRIVEIHRREGRIADAIAVLKQARKRLPKSVEIRVLLVGCYLDVSDADGVIREARSALRMAPHNLYLLDALSLAYLQKGDVDSTIKVMKKIICISPLDSVLRFKLAALYQHRGDLNRSMEQYRIIQGLRDGNLLHIDTANAMANVDQMQVEQAMMLIKENSVFRAKLQRDVETTLEEYGFAMSEAAVDTIRAVVDEGFLEQPFPRISAEIH